MLHEIALFFLELLKKQNPPLKIKDGKNCYEKEKLPLTHISDTQI